MSNLNNWLRISKVKEQKLMCVQQYEIQAVLNG